MKIQDVLNKNVMLFDLQATDKEGVINMIKRLGTPNLFFLY